MKRVILFGLILNSFFAMAQIPPSEGPELYGTRHFISLDGTDTLAIYHGTDTTHLISTDSIYIHKLMNVSGSGVSDHGSLTGLDDPNDHPWALEWNDTISTIATRTWSTSQFEPKFTKNTAFNKNFGTTAGTVAEGNDSRILNCQTAYSWGDHSVQGYATETWVGTNYLGITDKAADADKLDGINSSQFLRSDVDDTASGVYTFNSGEFCSVRIVRNITGPAAGGIRFGNNSQLYEFFGNDTRVGLRLEGSYDYLMVWGSNRNVGIGTPSPTEKLHVNGNGLFTGGIGVGGYKYPTNNGITIGGDGRYRGIMFYTGSDLSARIYRDNNYFYIGARGGDTAKGITINSDGWVGVNTTNPTEKLHVGGNILASGEVTADNINTTVQSLSGTTVTWNVSSGHNATITLSGNTTITMSNLVAGTTGNLTVINPASAYTITFSGYTFLISPILGSSGDTITMSGNSEKDVLSWYYDGTQVFINGTFSYE